MQQSKDFFSSSPTVVLPPSQPPQTYFANSHYVANNVQMTDALSQPLNATPNGSAPITPSAGAIAGRKRSRGDIHAPEDEDGRDEDGSIATPATEANPKPRGQPVFGPGMTVIYPDDPGYPAYAESQSGTWVEEQTASMHTKRPSITSRKSQRMNSTANTSEDLAQLVLPPTMREVTEEPLIDEATRTLGISWTRMDLSETRQISSSAYAKWIQNHYSCLKDVSVWFENSAVPCYLVCARNAYSSEKEYYLFSYDLTEARLITREPAQLVPRLQALPALHLAAPGGTIHAETDPISADQNELNTAQAAIINGSTSSPEADKFDEPNGMCAAHSMELD